MLVYLNNIKMIVINYKYYHVNSYNKYCGYCCHCYLYNYDDCYCLEGLDLILESVFIDT